MIYRLKNALLHLSVSVVLAFFSIYLVFGLWYPPPIHTAVGATDIFLLLLCVDVILGPVLTFIVSENGKKYLKLDLSIIIVVQLCAFLYGLYVMAEGRAVWLVFNVDRFDLVQVYQVSEKYKARARSEYQALSWTGPKLIAAQEPAAGKEHTNLVFESIEKGVDLPQRPDLYVAYELEAENVKLASRSLDDLYAYNNASEVKEQLSRWPKADAFLPMVSRIQPMTVLIEKNTGAVVAVVPLAPWL